MGVPAILLNRERVLGTFYFVIFDQLCDDCLHLQAEKKKQAEIAHFMQDRERGERRAEE